MADSKKPADSGEREVQARLDAIQEKGYEGDAVDDRDRADYTVKGSVARAGENLDQ